jgi:hypothetical protein
MFSLGRHVGRLVELRFASPLTGEEIDTFQREQKALERTGSERVACTDCRALDIMSPDHTARVVAALRQHNRWLLRNGVLVSGAKATLALQLDRVLRESRSPGRRLFREVDEVIAWLDEVLDGPERERLRAFLGRT